VDTITSNESPVTSIECIPGTDIWIIALADQIMYLGGDEQSQFPESSIQGESIVALRRVSKNDSNHTLFALTRNGMIWRCEN